MQEEIGTVMSYLELSGVATVAMCGRLRKEMRVLIKGRETNFEQVVTSIQLEHISIDSASPGDSVGIKVDRKVCEGDRLYRLL